MNEIIIDRTGDPVAVDVELGNVFLTTTEAGGKTTAAFSSPVVVRELADALARAADELEAQMKREGVL